MSADNLLKVFEVRKLDYGYDDDLEIEYINSASASLIREALAFWSFVRKRTITGEIEKEKENGDEIKVLKPRPDRDDFLSAFIGNENRFIDLIARIELLPTKIWRKVLGQENVNFESWESFLRRIDVDQIAALSTALSNWQKGCLDTFSKKEIFWGRITIESLKDTVIDYDKRYMSKGSYSYNIGGLDFGFNQYSGGLSDDTRVTERGVKQFFSISNFWAELWYKEEEVNKAIHEKLFVVDEDDGKYWWYFRKSRSNCVQFPNKEVKLGHHICPGFWYTLGYFILMWFVSPLAGIYVLADGGWDSYFAMILAAPVAVWLSLAAARALLCGIANSILYILLKSLGKEGFAKWDFHIGHLMNGILHFAYCVIVGGYLYGLDLPWHFYCYFLLLPIYFNMRLKFVKGGNDFEIEKRRSFSEMPLWLRALLIISAADIVIEGRGVIVAAWNWLITEIPAFLAKLLEGFMQVFWTLAGYVAEVFAEFYIFALIGSVPLAAFVGLVWLSEKKTCIL